MDKGIIINEIKRIAKANDGKPPGRKNFNKFTGIKDTDWYPHFWLNWGDALEEAGFQRNKWNLAFDEEYLIEKFAVLIKEIGHFPVAGEVHRKCKQDSTFPNYNTIPFNRFGGKVSLSKKIIAFCDDKKEWQKVSEICGLIAYPKESQAYLAIQTFKPTGFVYLLKSGKHYKIGKSKALGRREYELSIQLPEPPNTVHSIKTDDPSGIEAYWHNRFASKRKGGEWFDLNPKMLRHSS